MTNVKTTATVAAKAKSVKNSDIENVTVTNSGDAPATGTVSQADAVSAVDAGSEQANIAPATEVDTSGAPQQIVPDVDLDHPAVDNDPRKGTTVAQNKIDFNDPNLDGPEAVAKMLNAQGVTTTTEPSSK